jgi:hypothetical protein
MSLDGLTGFVILEDALDVEFGFVVELGKKSWLTMERIADLDGGVGRRVERVRVTGSVGTGG